MKDIEEIRKCIEDFKGKRESSKPKLKYIMVDKDVFRIDFDSMKNNPIVRSQLNT